MVAECDGLLEHWNFCMKHFWIWSIVWVLSLCNTLCASPCIQIYKSVLWACFLADSAKTIWPIWMLLLLVYSLQSSIKVVHSLKNRKTFFSLLNDPFNDNITILELKIIYFRIRPLFQREYYLKYWVYAITLHAEKSDLRGGTQHTNKRVCG